jgi:large exoprotein involved in heme utilization and adhesion
VSVSTRRLTLTDGAVISGTSLGPGAAGAITVNAEEFARLSGDDTKIASSAVGAGEPAGAAGDVSVMAGSLALTGGAQISSSSFGAGRGGTVTVQARESVEITGRSRDGFPSGIFSSAEGKVPGAGAGGSVSVSTRRLTLADGAVISGTSFGPGAGGTVRVAVEESAKLLGSGSQVASSAAGAGVTAGAAGDVIITAGSLMLAGGAQISGSSFGTGRGGTVAVHASESMHISGQSSDGRFPSGIFSSANATTSGAGPGGALSISTRELTLADGAQISGTSVGPGAAGSVAIAVEGPARLAGEGTGVFSRAAGAGTIAGAAGDVSVSAGTLTLTSGAQISNSSLGAGRGGRVTVDALDAVDLSASRVSSNAEGSGAGGNIEVKSGVVRLTGNAQISATSSGQGDAGSIRITAPIAFVGQDSSVTTAARGADGGNIVLEVGTLVNLVDSQITASVQGGEGKGGNITIDPRFVVLDHSRISADAFGGSGGNVRILADVFLATDSLVSASSALGVPGTVDINARITDVSGNLTQLPDAVLQAAALLREPCMARTGEGRTSTLTLGSRDGVPPEPGGTVASPLVLEATEAEPAQTPGPAAGRRQLSLSPLFALRCPK